MAKDKNFRRNAYDRVDVVDRLRRQQAEHDANDAFVRRTQKAQEKYAGRIPSMREASMNLGAYMLNDGEHAQDMAKEMTVGLDKVAFPVK